MNDTFAPTKNVRQQGSILVVTMCILGVLALVAGATLAAISAHYKTVWRTAAWHEALLTAESGIDMTIAQIAGLLPDIQINPQTGVALASTSISSTLSQGLLPQIGGLSLNNGVSLSITPSPLVHAGDGATSAQATVTIDVLPLNQVLSGNLLSNALSLLSSSTPPTINLLRLTSTGTVVLPGSDATGEIYKTDADFLHLALSRDPLTGKSVAQPSVSRQIQVLLKPVFPFDRGVSASGPISAPNSSSVFDSFSSASPLTSTNNLYDSQKRRSNIYVATDWSSFGVAGQVYGDVSTNGGNVVKGTQITGSVNNSYFQTLPSLGLPSWNAVGPSVTGKTTISGGALLTPTHYNYTQVNGTLHVTGTALSGLGGLLGGTPVGTIVSSEADIYVSGNFSGTLVVDSGVTVKLYVGGNLQFASGALQNANNVAANVQIYGVPSSSTSPTMTIDTTGGVEASIYAPGHSVTLTGNGDFSGAISAGQLAVSGNAGVHFDEALALQPGPILGYSLVSWQEITPQTN